MKKNKPGKLPLLNLIGSILCVIAFLIVMGVLIKEVSSDYGRLKKTDIVCWNYFAENYCRENNCIVIEKTETPFRLPKIYDYNLRQERVYELTPEEIEFCKK